MSRTIVVTGASSGIGRSICEMLLSEGHRVIGLARDHSKFTPDTELYSTKTVDLSQSKEVSEVFEQILKEFPQLCTVISNAGVGAVGSLEQFSMQQIEASIQMNLVSHLFVARCVVPHFKKNGTGDLIFTGSEAKSKSTFLSHLSFFSVDLPNHKLTIQNDLEQIEHKFRYQRKTSQIKHKMPIYVKLLFVVLLHVSTASLSK